MEFAVDNFHQHSVAVYQRELAPELGRKLQASATDELAALDVHEEWLQSYIIFGSYELLSSVAIGCSVGDVPRLHPHIHIHFEAYFAFWYTLLNALRPDPDRTICGKLNDAF
jgi:hypothetical protein